MTKKELQNQIEYLQETLEKRLQEREKDDRHLRLVSDEQQATIQCLTRENRKLWQLMRIYANDPTLKRELDLDIETTKKGNYVDKVF